MNIPRRDLDPVIFSPDATIRDAITSLNQSGLGIVLVADARRRLLGTITDGDIRRALVQKLDLEQPLAEVLRAKQGQPYERPVTAPEGERSRHLLSLFRKHAVEQIPLLSADGAISGLVLRKDLEGTTPETLPVRAVIMAGGKGSRLMPLTHSTPKPMLKIGDRPMLEHILMRIRESGIEHVYISLSHQPDTITDYFGDGSEHKLTIEYLHEERPLGTAGSLQLIQDVSDTLLVINGDVLTDLDFRHMHQFHHDEDAALTLAVRRFDVYVPYGIVHGETSKVTSVEEKPTFSFSINAGVYFVEPEARKLIPSGEPFSMTDLIGVLIAKGHNVVKFPLHENWIDIGYPEDYERAQREYQEGKFQAIT
jgi:dTDP-glucose pyrophosphorylase